MDFFAHYTIITIYSTYFLKIYRYLQSSNTILENIKLYKLIQNYFIQNLDLEWPILNIFPKIIVISLYIDGNTFITEQFKPDLKPILIRFSCGTTKKKKYILEAGIQQQYIFGSSFLKLFLLHSHSKLTDHSGCIQWTIQLFSLYFHKEQT